MPGCCHIARVSERRQCLHLVCDLSDMRGLVPGASGDTKQHLCNCQEPHSRFFWVFFLSFL